LPQAFAMAFSTFSDETSNGFHPGNKGHIT